MELEGDEDEELEPELELPELDESVSSLKCLQPLLSPLWKSESLVVTDEELEPELGPEDLPLPDE